MKFHLKNWQNKFATKLIKLDVKQSESRNFFLPPGDIEASERKHDKVFCFERQGRKGKRSLFNGLKIHFEGSWIRLYKWMELKGE